jgi:hypothetical protein
MNAPPVPPDAHRVKTTSGLRLHADPPERDERGRLLSKAAGKSAQQARMRQAEAQRAAAAAAAAMLPTRGAAEEMEFSGAESGSDNIYYVNFKSDPAQAAKGVRQVLEPKRTLRNRSGSNVRCRRQGSRQLREVRPGSAMAASRL